MHIELLKVFQLALPQKGTNKQEKDRTKQFPKLPTYQAEEAKMKHMSKKIFTLKCFS